MKKTLAIILALVMILCLATTAFAAGEGSITITASESGKTYELYKIFDLTMSGTNYSYTIATAWETFFSTGAGKDYIVDTNSGSLNAITVGGVTKYINITEANVAEFSQKALEYAVTLTADKSATGTGSDLTISGLDLGYYLVYPVGATEIKDSYKCICSLTSTIPNATVTIKAEYPSIEKSEVTSVVSADVGSIIDYKITGEVPDTTGYTTYTYVIKDTMTNLKYNKDLVVTVGGADVTSACSKTETDAGFELSIPVMNYTAGAEIVVTYSATVTEEAVINGATNEATLEYSNGPDETETTVPETEKVYSSKIVVDKIDGNTSAKLAGAEFVLMNKDGAYYHWNDTDKKVEWVTYDKADKFVTDDSGVATFNGLADGTYTLIETKAPDGYNKLTNGVEVTVTGTEETNKGVSVSRQVENNSGSTLPSTGGIGTTLFYIFGGILVVGAVVLLVTKKRMSVA